MFSGHDKFEVRGIHIICHPGKYDDHIKRHIPILDNFLSQMFLNPINIILCLMYSYESSLLMN